MTRQRILFGDPLDNDPFHCRGTTRWETAEYCRNGFGYYVVVQQRGKCGTEMSNWWRVELWKCDRSGRLPPLRSIRRKTWYRPTRAEVAQIGADLANAIIRKAEFWLPWR